MPLVFPGVLELANEMADVSGMEDARAAALLDEDWADEVGRSLAELEGGLWCRG